MKLKPGYIVQEVAGQWVVLNLDAASVNFDKMITLNESSQLLWKKLEEGATEADLVQALTDVYDVSEERALADVRAVVAKLSDLGCLE